MNDDVKKLYKKCFTFFQKKKESDVYKICEHPLSSKNIALEYYNGQNPPILYSTTIFEGKTTVFFEGIYITDFGSGILTIYQEAKYTPFGSLFNHIYKNQCPFFYCKTKQEGCFIFYITPEFIQNL